MVNNSEPMCILFVVVSRRSSSYCFAESGGPVAFQVAAVCAEAAPKRSQTRQQQQQANHWLMLRLWHPQLLQL